VDHFGRAQNGSTVMTTSNKFGNLGLTLATNTLSANGQAIIVQETMPKRTNFGVTPFSGD
jgi:hypothetical protein